MDEILTKPCRRSGRLSMPISPKSKLPAYMLFEGVKIQDDIRRQFLYNAYVNAVNREACIPSNAGYNSIIIIKPAMERPTRRGCLLACHHHQDFFFELKPPPRLSRRLSVVFKRTVAMEKHDFSSQYTTNLPI